MSQYKKHTPSKTKGGSLFNSPLDFLPGSHKVTIVAVKDNYVVAKHDGNVKRINHSLKEDMSPPLGKDVEIEVGMSEGVVIKMKGGKVQLLNYHTGFIHGEMEMYEVMGFMLLNQLQPSVPVLLSWRE